MLFICTCLMKFSVRNGGNFETSAEVSYKQLYNAHAHIYKDIKAGEEKKKKKSALKSVREKASKIDEK